ncbi:hypothetical protein MYX65_00385 [Acidobacteria bacterium AH-259-L09]|nr:hypothetical protein [Acidobacteria bacterium AH-259-L09]
MLILSPVAMWKLSVRGTAILHPLPFGFTLKPRIENAEKMAGENDNLGRHFGIDLDMSVA